MTLHRTDQIRINDAFPPHAGPGLHAQQFDGQRQRWALSLLLTGHGSEDDPVAQRFAQFASEQGYELDMLWVGFQDGAAEAAVMVIPSPGRTGMVFMSPMNRQRDVEFVRQLLEHAAQHVDRERCGLIQGLLDPPQRFEVDALGGAGFCHLADLLYMQRRIPRRVEDADLEPEFAVTTWADADRSRFEAAILASYENTLDCPALVGRRSIEDIIAGHMASGIFDPDLWYVVEKGTSPVGVMLLNRSSQHPAIELVYFGLAAAWRGKGIGRTLLNRALAVAREHHLSQVTLAVDESNLPAMSLYHSLGFVGHARKVAMMRTLD